MGLIRRRVTWNGRSVVAVVIAAGVSLSVLALAVAASVAEASQRLTLSKGAVTVLSTALGAMIGAVATYLGLSRDDDGQGGSEGKGPGGDA